MLIGLNGTSYSPARNATVKFRRSVEYCRFPSQKTFDELNAKYKGFSGPIGSGKSKALCMEAIKRAYINPGCRGLIGSPTYRLLTDSTLVELLATLDDKKIPHKFHKSAYAIHLPEPDSLILLRTMDEPERLRAMNLGWFGVDELSYCKEAAWTRLEGRMRDPNAKYKCGFAVWTPKGRDWVWRKFISARKVALYSVVLAKPFENRAILDATPDFYDNLKLSYDEKFYRQEVLGEYIDQFSGAVYHAFADDNVSEFDYDPNLPLIIAMDFNVNPMCGGILQCEHFAGRNYVRMLRELVLPGSHTIAWLEELCRRLKPWAEASKTGPLQLRFYGDAAGGSRQANSGGESNWSLVQKFMGAQPLFRATFHQKKQNPAVQDRVNAMNTMLCSFGEGHKTAGDRYFKVDRSCKEFILDMEDGRWKVDSDGNTYPELDKSDPKRTHISDAIGYYIEKEHSFVSRGGATRQTF